MNKFLVLVIMFLLVVPSTLAVTQAHGLSMTSTSGGTVCEGMRIMPTQNINLNTVSRHPSSTYTDATLRNSTFGVLDHKTFSGQNATFDYNLTAGLNYYVTAEGTTVTRYYENHPGLPFPVNNSLLNWTGSQSTSFPCNGTTIEYNDYVFGVVSVGATALTPASANNTFTMDVTNLFNNSALENVNVTFYNDCSANTTGAGIATISDATCSGLPSTLTGVNLTAVNYTFNETSYTIVGNTTGYAEGYQSLFNITITEIITNNTVTNYTLNTTGGKSYSNGTNVYLKWGYNDLTFSKLNWYNLSFNVTTGAASGTTNQQGAYNSILSVNATNAFTGLGINNFSLNISNTTYSYLTTLTTTVGEINVSTIQGLTLFMVIDAAGYAITNTTLSPSTTQENYTFNIYSNNSILTNIFDADTGVRITSNITIIISGNATSDTYTTTAGLYLIENLTDGLYTIKFQGANYTLRSYSVTVANRSTQVLNAFLSASTNTVIFSLFDSQTNGVLEGVSIGMYRIINSTLTLVESKSSDITGRAQLVYTTGVKYSFVMSLTNYTTTSFSLDPILFSSYNIYLDPNIVETQEYNDVGVTFTPSKYFNDVTNNFTFAINSPNGILTAYNVTVTWPNGTYTNAGANANGGSFSSGIAISSASIIDTVNITYKYTTVFGVTKQFTKLYTIIGGDSSTIINNINNDFGLGIFERTFFGVILTILIAGLAMLFTNKEFGLFMGLLTQGILVYIGFFPLITALLSLLIGIFVLIKMQGSG